jgi:hypothetical protein
MLDADLARLYGVATKRLNEQVKRNRDRFPADFMLQLTQDEKAEVVADCDHLKSLRFSPSLPNAFTEHGAVMLAAVLQSPQGRVRRHPCPHDASRKARSQDRVSGRTKALTADGHELILHARQAGDEGLEPPSSRHHAAWLGAAATSLLPQNRGRVHARDLTRGNERSRSRGGCHHHGDAHERQRVPRADAEQEPRHEPPERE